jgi:hypothetical protein
MKIEGFFKNIKRANKVVEELKKEGFSNAAVDINDHFTDRNVETNLPGTVSAPSLSGLVLKSGDYAVERAKAPLTAASPMVSGMGGFEEIADVNYKIVVEADEKDIDKVKQIISKLGGNLDSPNINIPKRVEDIRLEDIRLEDVDL